ncbi:DUF1127 domain-containing protein [Marinivivus vitaminiproducens]|uniref:DUF1127 domain-containing protein n=1 Tax=Marinivivus vitaminiproducens TaxID=3035935 RepID=UPI002798AC20|nr:DUF1127 domain-containing protein [Geminicoccaceae bacterium SCSIO 64248]
MIAYHSSASGDRHAGLVARLVDGFAQCAVALHPEAHFALSDDREHATSTREARTGTNAVRKPVLERLVAASLGYVRRFRYERTMVKAMRQLESLDDHALKDIGLHRCEIECAVRLGRDSVELGRDVELS